MDLQEEYDELLKYAVVVPTYDPRQLPKSLKDLRGSFPGRHEEMEQEGDETVTEDGGAYIDIIKITLQIHM